MGEKELQTGFVVALSTTASMEEAKKIARVLIERRLAACVNLVPEVLSIYRWKGDVCTDDEVLLVIKTRRTCLAKIKQVLGDLHQYEVPELIALDIMNGLENYLHWVQQETGCDERTE